MWGKRVTKLGDEDVRTRLAALEELHASLQSSEAKEAQIPEDYIQDITAEVSKACTDNNSKVMEKAFQCMPSIINQLGESVRTWQKSLMHAAIDALGHTKSTVRDAACDTMIGIATTSSIEDATSKIQKLHQHKNWRSRQQLCFLYERMLFEIELPFHRLAAEGRAVLSQNYMVHVPSSLSQALSLLDDAQAPVREAAVKCLSALVAVKGRRVLQEIERRKIRSGQLDRIVSISNTMVSELGISNNPQARPASSTNEAEVSSRPYKNSDRGTNSVPGDVQRDFACPYGGTTDVPRTHSADNVLSKATEHPKQSYGTEAAENEISSTSDVLIEQHRSPLWTPGVIGFTGIAGRADIIRIKGPDHLRSQIEEVLRNLGPTRSTDWKARCDAISKFRGILAAGKGNSSELMAMAKPLREALAEQVSDLRSQIVKIGCCAVAELSAAMTSNFEKFAGPIVSNLLKLVINSVSVMACSGHEAIMTIIHNAPSGYQRLIPLICKHVCNSRSAKLRSCCGEYILNMCRGWSATVLEKHWELLGDSIKSLIVDADEDARKIGRLAFWSYSTMFQNEAKTRIFDHLDSTAQKLIQQNENEARQCAKEALQQQVTEIPTEAGAPEEERVHEPLPSRPPREMNGQKQQRDSNFQKKRISHASVEEQDENVGEDDFGSLKFDNVVQQARDASEFSSAVVNKDSTGLQESEKAANEPRKDLKERTFDEVAQICLQLENEQHQGRHQSVASLSRIAQLCRSSVPSKSNAEISAYKDALSAHGYRILNSLGHLIETSGNPAAVDALVALDALLKCPFVVHSFRAQGQSGGRWMQVLRDLIFPLLRLSTVSDERLASTSADVLKQCFLALGVDDFIPAVVNVLQGDSGMESATLELLRVIISTPQGQLYFCNESENSNQTHMLNLVGNCAVVCQKPQQAVVTGLKNLLESLYRVNRKCFTKAIFELPREPQSRLLTFLESYANHMYHSIQPNHPSTRAYVGGYSAAQGHDESTSTAHSNARHVFSGGEKIDSSHRPPPPVEPAQSKVEVTSTSAASVTPQSNVPSFSQEELIHSQGQLEDTLNELFSTQFNLLKNLHLVGHVVVSRDTSRQQLWKANKEYIIKAILSTMAPTIAAADSNPTAIISAGLAIIRRISRFHSQDISEANMANMLVTELLHTVALYHNNKEIVFSLQKTVNELVAALEPPYLCLAPLKRSLMMFKRNTGEDRGDAPQEVVPASVALKALKELLATQVVEQKQLSREDILQFVLDPAGQFMSAVRNIFLSTVADLRKNLVLAMVEVCLICGDDLEPALQRNLSDPQRKLLAIYVQRAKRTRNTDVS